jgi:hypothetical protein
MCAEKRIGRLVFVFRHRSLILAAKKTSLKPEDVWHVMFLEPGLQKPLPKTLAFSDEGKIRELARRGEAWQTSEDRQMLDYAIAKGEGGVYLQ